MRIRPLRSPLLAALLALSSLGPAAARGDLVQRATEAYRASDWPATEAAALEMLGSETTAVQGHFYLAVALMHRGEGAQALIHLDQAESGGYPALAVDYRRACALATLGRVDEAISALQRAVSAGFARKSLLTNEPLLAPARDDVRFPALLEEIEKTLHPCLHDPRYRQFDFWIGTWDVRPNGAPESTPPSENVITLDYDECVVIEHWTGTSGVTGSSFNLFDASRGEWFQTWVDSTGGLHEYHGRPDADGNMLFEGTTPGAPGKPRVQTRLSFFQLGPDRVRQLSETPTADGTSWSVNYDLIYVRRPGSASR